MMAREGLIVESQTLWDQLNALARHLEPTYDALARRALEAPVINVDETRWAIMGSQAGRRHGVDRADPDRVVLSHPARQVDGRGA